MNKLFAALALLSIPASAMAEDKFSLGTGFDYSSGKYGDTVDTKILYIPVIAKYETGDLTFKLTVPYISITGQGGVVQGMGRMGKTTKMTPTTNSGLGDITGSVGYNVYSGNALSFDVIGNVKLGTADSKTGLGTGQNDYSGQIDGYYTRDKTTLFATAGYKVYGAPAGSAASNGTYSMLGASRKLTRTATAGVMLYTAQSASATGTGPREATLFVSQKLSPTLKVQANVLKGFSAGSPDFGGGVMVTGYF